MSTYSSAVLADSPLGYWRLGDSSGTASTDLGSGGHNGAYVGTPTLHVSGATSDADGGVTFSASTAPRQYVSVSGLTIPTAAITLEAWAKGSFSGADSGLVGQWSSTGAFLYLNSTADLVQFYKNGTAISYTATGVLRNGSWHHIVGTWDGTSSRLYFDGALVAGPTSIAGAITPAGSFYIGQYGTATAGAFDGSVDEAAVYSSALTLTRVQAHYSAATATNVTATPPAATLTLTGYAPTVTVSGGVTSVYIAPGGNDTTGNGSLATPWRTWTKAYATASAGTTIWCRGGTYVGADVTAAAVESVGTVALPITIRAYPGEVPVFDGASAGGAPALWYRKNAAYHVVDGLVFVNWTVTSSAVVLFGGDVGGITSNCTIRRCTVYHRAGQSATEHAIYLSGNSDYITVGGAMGDGNRIIGTNANTSGSGAAVECNQGAANGYTHASTNATVSWNAVDSMSLGIHTGVDDSTGAIGHNTVAQCYNAVDTRYGTWTVSDNVCTAVQNLGISDLYSGAHAITKDHNYEGQTVASGSMYGLVSGDSAISGAADGSDAGWIDWPVSLGVSMEGHGVG